MQSADQPSMPDTFVCPQCRGTYLWSEVTFNPATERCTNCSPLETSAERRVTTGPTGTASPLSHTAGTQAGGNGAADLARVLLLVAAVFLVWGFRRLLAIGGEDRIVGGDAYNYMITTTRGVGLIGIAVALTVAAAVWALFAIRAQLSVRTDGQPGASKGSGMTDNLEQKPARSPDRTGLRE